MSITLSLISPGTFLTVPLFFSLSGVEGEVLFFFFDCTASLSRVLMFRLLEALLGDTWSCFWEDEAVLFFSECTASLFVLFAASVFSPPVFMLQWSLSRFSSSNFFADEIY